MRRLSIFSKSWPFTIVFITGVFTFGYNACSPGGFSVNPENMMNSASTGVLGGPGPSPGPGPISDPVVLEGKTLYANTCQVCHGTLLSSTKRNVTADKISNALNTISQMAHLKGTLSSAQIDALVGVLKDNMETPIMCNANEIGKTVVRRMNFREFYNSTRDLFGVASDLTKADYPPDRFGGAGFDTQDIALRLTTTETEQIVTAAEKVVDKVMANTSSTFNACNTSSNKATCISEKLLTTARKAFRRNVTQTDIQGLITLASQTDTKTGMRDALVAMIASPRFLFHVVDYSTAAPNTIHNLNSYELASRLSFFLWSTIPDDELLGLAASNGILDPATLRAQVGRMLGSPKAQEFIKSFPSQWLGYRTLGDAVRSSTIFPEFTPTLKAAMVKESDLLFEDVISRNLPVDTLVNADYTFVDRTLASLYGVQFPATTSSFAPVMLDGTKRRGILTHASFMASTSKGNSTNPIHRGNAVLNRILCDPVGSPPTGINPLVVDGTNKTVREILSMHRVSDCANCHNKIDPPGLGYENFDAIGKWRDTHNNLPIDASGITTDGVSFTYPGEFSSWIATGPKFERCINRYINIYAIGRDLVDGDKCQTDKALQQMGLANGHTLKSLIENVVTSELFRKSVRKE